MKILPKITNNDIKAQKEPQTHICYKRQKYARREIYVVLQDTHEACVANDINKTDESYKRHKHDICAATDIHIALECFKLHKPNMCATSDKYTTGSA